MDAMKKTVRVGTIYIGHQPASIFCKIGLNDGKLSISGVIGPLQNGDARGSSGQILTGFKEYDARGRDSIADINPAPGWDHDLIHQFFNVWDRWHLNDMRAGCEHQRAEKWNERRIDPDKPLTDYGLHFPGQKYPSWNMLAWILPEEHPDGLLTAPCPICGYKYGSSWLHEDVPDDVIDFLRGLPDSDKVPAWV